MNKLDKSWIAGFFEGEGSCGVYKTKVIRSSNKIYYSKTLRVGIGQKDKTPLIFIKSNFGGCLHLRKNSGIGKNKLWFWECGSNIGRNFLRAIKPYLKSSYKLKQVSVALKEDYKFHHNKPNSLI